VVVLNITMPVPDGIAVAREITEMLPESAIVILSSHADKHFIEQGGRGAHDAIEAAVIEGDFVLID
jgi:DNA-binding NarL/FixJ family response regulator